MNKSEKKVTNGQEDMKQLQGPMNLKYNMVCWQGTWVRERTLSKNYRNLNKVWALVKSQCINIGSLVVKMYHTLVRH